jgi:hypothetical protein
MSADKALSDGPQDGWMNWRNTLQQKVHPQKALMKPLRASGLSVDRQHDIDSLPEAANAAAADELRSNLDDCSQVAAISTQGGDAFTLWTFLVKELSWGSSSGSTHNRPGSSENSI